jgi:hypothetical protein
LFVIAFGQKPERERPPRHAFAVVLSVAEKMKSEGGSYERIGNSRDRSRRRMVRFLRASLTTRSARANHRLLPMDDLAVGAENDVRSLRVGSE